MLLSGGGGGGGGVSVLERSSKTDKPNSHASNYTR